VTSTSGFGDDLLHFVDLGLGAADCAELEEDGVSKILLLFCEDSRVRKKCVLSSWRPSWHACPESFSTIRQRGAHRERDRQPP
jgi:hypothetical protein